MILPVLNGLLNFRKAPVTWILFLLNAAVFLAGVVPSVRSQAVIDKSLDNNQFLATQGEVYSQYVKRTPQSHSLLISKLADKAINGENDKLRLLGSLAIRDSDFLDRAFSDKFHGDVIELKHWRRELEQMRLQQDLHPSYQLGLTSDEFQLDRWISYIFVHSGPYHFLGNMYFLLIFGSLLEPIVGGLALLVVFLGTGLVAAGTFLLLTGATAAPLIGASGAVSGVMALLCFFYWRRPVRFMYFVLPSSRYVGFIFLPGWVILGMFFLSDLAGYLGTSRDFGGVAYTAHLGGEAMAFVIGLFLIGWRKLLNRPALKAVVSEEAPMGRPLSVHEMTEILRNQGARSGVLRWF